MKVCFLAVNAKYIHTNPAVRLLTKVTRSKYDADFKSGKITIVSALNLAMGKIME